MREIQGTMHVNISHHTAKEQWMCEWWFNNAGGELFFDRKEDAEAAAAMFVEVERCNT